MQEVLSSNPLGTKTLCLFLLCSLFLSSKLFSNVCHSSKSLRAIVAKLGLIKPHNFFPGTRRERGLHEWLTSTSSTNTSSTKNTMDVTDNTMTTTEDATLAQAKLQQQSVYSWGPNFTIIQNKISFLKFLPFLP